MNQAALRLVTRDDSDKQRALEAALTQIDRAFGKGSVMSRSRRCSTGSPGLDIALGIGGLPKGRVVEIYGPESSGKTTLALHVVAEVQKAGGTAPSSTPSTRWTPVYARKLGVNLDDLLVSQPDTGEQALEITDTLVRSGAVDVMVVDSVAALTPRAEIEGEMGDALPGLQARLMSQALRKLTASISKLQHPGDLHQPDPHEDRRDVRQPRDDHRRQRAEVLRLGAPRHPPHRRDQGPRRGGRQQTSASRWSRTRSRRRSSRSSSTSCTARASPRLGELIDLGVKAGVVEKSGAWFSYGDSQRIGQGRDNVREFLKAASSTTSGATATRW
jgi:recombination protein RecA